MCLFCREENLEGLTEIDCSGCYNLITMPFLPASLTRLDCHSCIYLEKLSELPNLLYLDCSSCFKITSIPILPASLTILEIKYLDLD